MAETPPIIIGGGTQGLTIKVLRRSHPECADYWDGNWLAVNVDLDVGRFQAHIPGDIRSEELSSFRDQLKRVYDSLNGSAEFHTMESWLGLNFVAHKTGRVALKGVVLDQPGIGNRLTFELALDQTYLPPILSALDDVISTFPVVGER
jgi:hypothetical protein